jgi:lysophospholipase L1-like esterase
VTGSWSRPPQPEPFLRGCAFPGTEQVPYPRADPSDFLRLPGDTWASAQLPVGVRLELVGDAEAVELAYVTHTDQLGYRGDGAGRNFSLWRGDELLDEAPACLGTGRVVLRVDPARGGEGPLVVYLPEGMRPLVVEVLGRGGSLEPAPRRPAWLAYGDSIAEGWVASGPALAWPAAAARRFGLDVFNFGYAGAARGEMVSAEQLAGLRADVISVTHGTNCWTRIPHSAGMMREGLRGFLRVLRTGHPQTPILVAGPVVRPDAESVPNKLGATLADLRRAMEDTCQEMITEGDGQLHYLDALPLVTPDMLPDGIHPGDRGHQALAQALGATLARLVRRDH